MRECQNQKRPSIDSIQTSPSLFTVQETVMMVTAIIGWNSTSLPNTMRSVPGSLRVSESLVDSMLSQIKVCMNFWPFIDFSGMVLFSETTDSMQCYFSSRSLFNIRTCHIPYQKKKKKRNTGERERKIIFIERQVERRKGCRG